MRFLDNEIYNKVKALADSGDEKAKNFLFTFMEMSDEEANAFLAEIATNEEPKEEQPVKEEWQQIVEALIQDENEAIDGYDKAIKFIANSDMPNLIKTSLTEKAEHIKSEELEHIEELKEMLEYGVSQR